MAQIWTGVGIGLGASNRVALDAAGFQEDLQAAPRRRCCRFGTKLRSLGQPGCELIWRQGYDDEGHVGVLRPAVFATLTPVGPGLVRLYPELVFDAGDEVAFAVQARHPEAMNDVGAGQFQP